MLCVPVPVVPPISHLVPVPVPVPVPSISHPLLAPKMVILKKNRQRSRSEKYRTKLFWVTQTWGFYFHSFVD